MKNITIIGKAGSVEFPKGAYDVDDFKITCDPNSGYFNLGSDNYSYVPTMAPVFATEEEVCTKHILQFKIETFIKHYCLPYSDQNAEKLAKFALDHCPDDTDILDFTDYSDADNMYDALCDILKDEEDIDAQDREFMENVDDIVDLLDLDYGNMAVSRLLGWIKNVFENANQDTNLIQLAFLKKMVQLIKADIPHFEKLIRSHQKLSDKLLSDDNLAFDIKRLKSVAQFEITNYSDIRDWNEKLAEDFIDTINRNLLASLLKR